MIPEIVEDPRAPAGWTLTVDGQPVDATVALASLAGDNRQFPGWVQSAFRLLERLRADDVDADDARAVAYLIARFVAHSQSGSGVADWVRAYRPPARLVAHAASYDQRTGNLTLGFSGFGNDDIVAAALDVAVIHDADVAESEDGHGRTIHHMVDVWHPIVEEGYLHDHDWRPVSAETLRHIYRHTTCVLDQPPDEDGYRGYECEWAARETPDGWHYEIPLREPEQVWQEQSEWLLTVGANGTVHGVARDRNEGRPAAPADMPIPDLDLYDTGAVTDQAWAQFATCGASWERMATVTDLRSVDVDICPACMDGGLHGHVPLDRLD